MQKHVVVVQQLLKIIFVYGQKVKTENIGQCKNLLVETKMMIQQTARIYNNNCSKSFWFIVKKENATNCKSFLFIAKK